MALMLENQAKQLVVEASSTGTGASFSVGSGENWAGIALPLVRKVFGQIAAKEFVSVQPMNLPSGLVFFLDFQYGTAKTPFTAGGSMYGNRNASSATPFSTTEAAGGLYGAGRFTYSTNQTSSVAQTLALGTAAATLTISSGSWANVNYDSALSASVAAGEVKALTVPLSAIPNYDPDAIRGFVISGSGVSATIALPAFTTTDLVANNITFFITASTATAAAGSYNVFFQKKTADNARGDFEDPTTQTLPTYSTPNAQSATTIAIPEINISMQSQAITAKTKKLKAVWTPEFAQDLNAYQNLDAEAELTNIMSEYISLEIDLEILDMLIQAAPSVTTEYWSAEIGKVWNGSAFAASSYTGTAWTNMTWYQTLGQKMQKVSNKIHQLTMRGGANFAVVSPTVATILETIPGFATNTDGDKMEFAGGVSKVGSFQNRFTIYKNPYMKENIVLMGFRGSNFLETGAVYAPYIPLIMTPLVYDPNNFTPRRGVMTRYAKKVVRPEFFGKIYIENLGLV